MGKWQEKLSAATRAECTANTAKSPPESSRATTDFLRLVRIIGVCERGLLIDDEFILAELDADDLRELVEADRITRQTKAQVLAHKLCDERLRRGPSRCGGKGR